MHYPHWIRTPDGTLVNLTDARQLEVRHRGPEHLVIAIYTPGHLGGPTEAVLFRGTEEECQASLWQLGRGLDAMEARGPQAPLAEPADAAAA